MDYNLHPKTQRVQQLHEKKHLGHDPTTSCENVRYNILQCDGTQQKCTSVPLTIKL